MKVDIYKRGPLTCSVCAPKEMKSEEVEANVNAQEVEIMRDVGLSVEPLPWQVSSDDHFASGGPMPCPCNQLPDTHKHWLLEV